jgi:PRTRC genetic system protein B
MEKIMELDMDDHMVPKFALIGYASSLGHYKTWHYFAYHRIVGECLTAGMPLTKDTAQNLFRCLEGDLIKFSFKGLLPKNLIHFDFKGDLHLMWIVRPKRHNLYFDARTGIPTGPYPLPKLVFSLKGNGLRVIALNRNDVLDGNTVLYHVPLPNINGQGKVCMGNVSMDYDGFEHYEDIMDFVEKQFFSSVFTETHHNDLVRGNLVQTMKRLNGKQRFDDSLLIANKLTLKQLYEK